MVEDLIKRLMEALRAVVQRDAISCLLFSGGLDTSILAWLLVRLNYNFKAITISLESLGGDIPYAKLLARKLNLDHYHRRIDIDEAIKAIPKVIKVLKSFDPAIPNDLAVYFGLKTAKEMDMKNVLTGDGADELFAGYHYMKDIKNLDEYIKRTSLSMSFSSNKIGEFFDIRINQPYLYREFVDFSISIPAEFKIREEDRKIYGKWILRKAFEDLLPEEILWQDKRPLEYGSGMTILREVISSKISDDEFEEKKKLYPVKFLNKEHLYYYEIFRKVGCTIPAPKDKEKLCPGCSAGLKVDAFHCKVCGYCQMKP